MKKLTLSVALAVATVVNAFACTNLIVGKNASADGSTIVSYSADSYGLFGELYHYPAGMHKKGTWIDVHEWDTGKYLGRIEQARQTYNVIGNMNEFQLTIGETTFGGRPELVDTTGIIDYGSLIYLGLQRSRTAREAIKVMTELVQEYGYYSSGESFTIADPNEIWIMEMIGKGPGVRGAVWVAVRVPDDCISAHANQSRIHQFDMSDKNNCMYSPDVISFAREKGYFDGVNKDFSFAKAYAPLDFGARRYCEARVWSYFNMFTARGNEFLPYILGDTDTPMPLFVKPDRKISVQDVKNAMRDHYEGTPLTLDNDPGMGPFEAPYRPTPLTWEVDGKMYFNERPISTQQSAFVMVAQMRSQLPDYVGGVLWFGCDDANMMAFTPVYCCTDLVPECYSDKVADDLHFSFKSAFWVCNWVSSIVYPRYSQLFGELKTVRDRLETDYNTLQEKMEKEAMALAGMEGEGMSAARKYLTAYTNRTAAGMLYEWMELGKRLMVKYIDGTVRPERDGQYVRTPGGLGVPVERPGYPERYRREIVKATGDRFEVK